MRLPIIAAAVVAVASPAFAQQSGPRPPAPPPVPVQPSGPAGFFPCRTADEVCFIGVVTGPSKVTVLYTNDPQMAAATAAPLTVRSVNGPLDLTPDIGRAVMLVGAFNGHGGLNNAQVVDVASPLTSFALKNMMGGDDSQQDAPADAPSPAPRR
jgi:hypothetical protein